MSRQAPKVKTERTVTKFDKNKKSIELVPRIVTKSSTLSHYVLVIKL